ncbi:MAG TPA: glycosyltransferase family A protein [Ruminiclostridium sp.]
MTEISVIIPFYNRIDWLLCAIKSVQEQTFADFEIIIIDDGSTDDMACLFKLKDDRIRYFKQENKGPAAARNLGIEKSKGNYIAFLDSDDVFLPQKLEAQFRFFNENKDVSMVHTSYKRISENMEVMETINSGIFSKNVYPQILSSCPIATPTVMVKRQVLNSLRFPEDIKIGEDVVLWIQIAKDNKVYGIDIPLSLVRMRDNSTSITPASQLEGNINILNFVMKFDSTLTQKYKIKRISEIYTSVAYLYYQNKDKKNCRKYIAKAWITNPSIPSLFIFTRLLAMILIPQKYHAKIKKILLYFRKRL